MPDVPLPEPSSHERERELFLEALELQTPEEQADFLKRACGSDSALRATVAALLANHKLDTFLETPAVDIHRDPLTENGPGGTHLIVGLTKPGDKIGRYKLLQEIGEGACGTVYMAEQEEPVRRRVALKIIKAGMDSKSVIARFEAERQALAMMDHPNIAQVFDAGTTETGRPYFVMELVRGIRITEYCDQNQLSTRERLNLFSRVCHAIQHAHQKGIIHRDIKPSNILVTLHDGVPVPKVIDFGIAKAIQQRLTDKTVFTHFQAFIGTPAYTSPEQAEMSGLDIDTRSDIYSLGVLLYELLTGETPFDPQHLVESGLDEMRRIIRQEEPERPSTRLSTLGMAEAAALSTSRQAAMPALVQALQGDIDWIVMKCLEKDRTRRYPTANALALDVQCYLDSEPVQARPPSTAYRLQKFIYRNRVMVGAGTVIGVVLICALVVSTWMAVRARQAEREQGRLRQSTEVARQEEATLRRQAERDRVIFWRRSYISDMNQVQLALAGNNYGRVIELLNRYRPETSLSGNGVPADQQPDFRQWEWRYFWNQSRREDLFALPRQPVALSAAAVSPNGRLLAVGDRFGAIKLWDLAARTEVAVVRKPGFGPPAFVFSRDGARLALTASDDRRRPVVTVLTVATRQSLCELPQDSWIDSLAFSSDDTKLLASSRDGRIGTWDLETRQRLSQTPIQASDGEQHRAASVFSPDAKWLAVRREGGVQIVDVLTGQSRSSIEEFEGDVSSLAFSPDGETLAAGPFVTGTSTHIKLFSTATGKELGELVGHGSWVPGLVFTPDGKRLISAGGDQLIRVWNLETLKEIASLRGHGSEVSCVAVTPDGKMAVSGGKDGTILAWDLDNLQRKEPYETMPAVSSVEFFPDSRGLLTVNADRSVSLWNAATLQRIEPVRALGNDVTRLLISPDGKRVYAGTGQGGIQVLDWATRLIITNLTAGPSSGRRPMGPGGPLGPGASGGPSGGPPGGQGEVGRPNRSPRNMIPLAVIEKGRILVTIGPANSVRLLDASTLQTTTEWKLGDGGPSFRSHFVVSPDGQSLVTVTVPSGTIEFRNLLTGEVATNLAAQTWDISGLVFSPDGSLLATSSVDGSVSLWDAKQHRLLEVLRGHLLGVHAVAFSPDGERLATVSHGNEAVKLWDVATRHEEVATLAGQRLLFRAAKFSPDGSLLVAISSQQSAYVWRAPSREEIAAIESAPNSTNPTK